VDAPSAWELRSLLASSVFPSRTVTAGDDARDGTGRDGTEAGAFS
jgi:hypothetical protein